MYPEFGNFLSVTTLFFSMSAFGYISLFVLALKWPKLMQFWEYVELSLANFQNHGPSKFNWMKIRYMAFLFLLCALSIPHSNIRIEYICQIVMQFFSRSGFS